MLSNIVDIDWESMKVSLKYERGALILFDFKAATPSPSHDSMRAILSHIGVPAGFLRAIQKLYVKS